MKIKHILPLLLLVFSFCSKLTIASSDKKNSSSKLLIGVNDSIVIDIRNSIKTIFSIDSSYLDIPLYIKSTQIITALDIQYQFNQSKLTYDIINDVTPGYLSSITNYRSTTDLYLVYGAYIANVSSNIATNINLAYVRFKFKTSCAFELNSTDFYNPLALLNGVVCSSKFTTLNATNLPNAQFINGAPCYNSNIQFADLSTVTGGTITAWNWNFGNGLNSTLQNPTSTYTATGTYTTSLIITEATGCTDTIRKTLTIGSSPLSSFSYTLDCLKDSVFFTNLSSISSGTISNSLWSFGDSGSSSLFSPSHQYNAGGTYTVSLTSTSTSSCVNTSTFAVVLDKPIANYVTSSINNCLGTTQNFSNTSTYTSGTIASWNWDFGDGNTSNLQNPSYTYTAAGVYTITLISASSLGCSGVITKTISINSKPVVQFSANNLTGCSSQTVNFTNTSTPTLGSLYTWSFGDGTSAIVQNPTHVYPTVGTYTVKLIATTVNGCIDSLIKPAYIAIYSSPITNFSVSSVCVNSIVGFTNNSSIATGSINSWNWNFGNSITSNLQNPVYSYTNPGTYSINLVATSNNGCKDSLTKTITIFPKPIVQFNANNLTGCSPLTTNFTDASTTSLGSAYLWNFGDNSTSSNQNPIHTYTTSGNYTVKLYVTNASGCLDSIIKTSYIIVNPSPIANFSATNFCQGSTTIFSDNSLGVLTSWAWSFGDGVTSNTQNSSHTYINSGVYTVILTVLNTNGCSSVITKTVGINSKPLVQFIADTLTGCSPRLINFSNQSTTVLGSIYLWYFGDNTTSNLQNPSHTYSVGGTYTVKLFDTQLGGCSDSLVKVNYITIISSPVALFTVPSNTINLPNAVANFSNTSVNYSTVSWIFGDSQTSTAINPNHTYSITGDFSVCLTAYNTLGCSNTYCDDILVTASNIVAVPSAFTPNGDNVNDVLKVRGGAFTEMEFKIFNEWGNLLFSSTSQNDGWNGKFKDDDQPTGLYEYTLKGITTENNIINLYGAVNLTR